MRGGVHRYAAQAIPQIDTARTEKNPFRMKTSSIFITVINPLVEVFKCFQQVMLNLNIVLTRHICCGLFRVAPLNLVVLTHWKTLNIQCTVLTHEFIIQGEIDEKRNRK